MRVEMQPMQVIITGALAHKKYPGEIIKTFNDHRVSYNLGEMYTYKVCEKKND